MFLWDQMAAEIGRTEFWSTNSIKEIIEFVWVECYKKANLYQLEIKRTKLKVRVHAF